MPSKLQKELKTQQKTRCQKYSRQSIIMLQEKIIAQIMPFTPSS